MTTSILKNTLVADSLEFMVKSPFKDELTPVVEFLEAEGPENFTSNLAETGSPEIVVSLLRKVFRRCTQNVWFKYRRIIAAQAKAVQFGGVNATELSVAELVDNDYPALPDDAGTPAEFRDALEELYVEFGSYYTEIAEALGWDDRTFPYATFQAEDGITWVNTLTFEEACHMFDRDAEAKQAAKAAKAMGALERMKAAKAAKAA